MKELLALLQQYNLQQQKQELITHQQQELKPHQHQQQHQQKSEEEVANYENDKRGQNLFMSQQNESLQEQLEEQQLALSQLTVIQSELENYIKNQGQQQTNEKLEFMTPRETLISPSSSPLFNHGLFRTPREAYFSPIVHDDGDEQQSVVIIEEECDSLLLDSSLQTKTMEDSSLLFSSGNKCLITEKKFEEIKKLVLDNAGVQKVDSHCHSHKVDKERELQTIVNLSAKDDQTLGVARRLDKKLQVTKDRNETQEIKILQLEEELKFALETKKSAEKNADTRIKKLEEELNETKESIQQSITKQREQFYRELNNEKKSMKRKYNESVDSLKKEHQDQNQTTQKVDFMTPRESLISPPSSSLFNSISFTPGETFFFSPMVHDNEEEQNVVIIEEEANSLVSDSLRLTKTMEDSSLFLSSQNKCLITKNNIERIRKMVLTNSGIQKEANHDSSLETRKETEPKTMANLSEKDIKNLSVARRLDEELEAMKDGNQTQEKDTIARILELKEELEFDVEVKKSPKNNVDTRIDKLEEELNETKNSIQQKISEEREHFQKNIYDENNSLQTKYDERVEDLEKEYHETIESMKDVANAKEIQLQTECNNAKKSMKEETYAQLIKLKKELNTANASIQEKDALYQATSHKLEELQQGQKSEYSMIKVANGQVTQLQRDLLQAKCRLQKDIEIKETELKKEFEKSKESLEREVTDQKTRMDELQKSIQAQDDKQEEAKIQISQLEEEVQKYKEVLQKDTESRTKQIQELSLVAETKEDIIQVSNSRIIQLEKEVLEKNKKMQQESKQEIAHLKEENQSIIKSMQTKIDSQLLQIDELNKSFFKNKEYIQKEVDARIVQLENKFRETNISVKKEADAGVCRLQRELEETKKSLQNAADASLVQINDYKSIIETKEYLQKETESRIIQLREELLETKESTPKQTNEQDAKIQELQLQLEKETEQKNISTEKIRKLEEELQKTKDIMQNDTNARVMQLEGQLRIMEKEKDVFETKVKDIELIGQKKEFMLQDAGTQMAKLNLNAKNLKHVDDCKTNKLDELQNALIMKEAQLQESKVELTNMQQNEKELRLLLEKASVQITEGELVINSLLLQQKEKLHSINETHIANMVLVEKDLNERKEKLKATLHESKDNSEKETKEKLAKMREEFDKTINTMLEETNKQMVVLQRRLQLTTEAKETMLQDTDHQIAELHVIIDEKKYSLEEANARVIELEQNLDNNARELDLNNSLLVEKSSFWEERLNSVIQQRDIILEHATTSLEEQLQETKEQRDKIAASFAKFKQDSHADLIQMKNTIDAKDSVIVEEQNRSVELRIELQGAEQEVVQKESMICMSEEEHLTELKKHKEIFERKIELELEAEREKANIELANVTRKFRKVIKILKAEHNSIVARTKKKLEELHKNNLQQSQKEIKAAMLKVKQLEEELDTALLVINSKKKYMDETLDRRNMVEKEMLSKIETIKADLNSSKDESDDVVVKALTESIRLMEELKCIKKEVKAKETTLLAANKQLENKLHSVQNEADAKIAELEKKTQTLMKELKNKNNALEEANNQSLELKEDEKLQALQDSQSQNLQLEQQFQNAKEEINVLTGTKEYLQEKIIQMQEEYGRKNLYETENEPNSQISQHREEITSKNNNESKLVLLLEQVAKSQSEFMFAVTGKVENFSHELQEIHFSLTKKMKEQNINFEEGGGTLNESERATNLEKEAMNSIFLEMKSVRSKLKDEKLCNIGSIIDDCLEKEQDMKLLSSFCGSNNTLSLLKNDIDRLLNYNNTRQLRLKELEWFLQQSLEEVEVRGEEARKLNQDLSASKMHNKKIDVKLLVTQGKVQNLLDNEQKLVQEKENKQKLHQKIEIEKKNQTKLIETLQRQIALDQEAFEEKQVDLIKNSENRIASLESEILNVVRTSSALEAALIANEKLLSCTHEIMSEMRVSSKESKTQKESLRLELDKCNSAKHDLAIKLVEVKSSVNELILVAESSCLNIKNLHDNSGEQTGSEYTEGKITSLKILKHRIDSIIRGREGTEDENENTLNHSHIHVINEGEILNKSLASVQSELANTKSELVSQLISIQNLSAQLDESQDQESIQQSMHSEYFSINDYSLCNDVRTEKHLLSPFSLRTGEEERNNFQSKLEERKFDILKQRLTYDDQKNNVKSNEVSKEKDLSENNLNRQNDRNKARKNVTFDLSSQSKNTDNIMLEENKILMRNDLNISKDLEVVDTRNQYEQQWFEEKSFDDYNDFHTPISISKLPPKERAMLSNR